MVYRRAVYDGMAPEDSDGKENDPREYFRKVNYEYLGSEHLKGVSFKRSCHVIWHRYHVTSEGHASWYSSLLGAHTCA
jgi:hypothetical protein